MRGTKNKQLCVYLKYKNYLTPIEQLDLLIKILVNKQQKTKSKRIKQRINTEITALVKLRVTRHSCILPFSALIC